MSPSTVTPYITSPLRMYCFTLSELMTSSKVAWSVLICTLGNAALRNDVSLAMLSTLPRDMAPIKLFIGIPAERKKAFDSTSLIDFFVFAFGSPLAVTVVSASMILSNAR